MNILLIEDNELIASSLSYTLKQNNYKTLIASTIEEAKEALVNASINLVILDLMLPDGSGKQFYVDFVKKFKIPVIILTAIDDEDEIASLINLGVEEYMTKPFKTKELLARINRLVVKQSNHNIISIKNIKYDLDKMELSRDNSKVNLSNIETRIINLLFINMNKVVSRNELLERIWDWTGNDVDDHTITVYLKRIREKIDTDIITTVKGIGYRIDVNEK